MKGDTANPQGRRRIGDEADLLSFAKPTEGRLASRLSFR